jgi:hypothetical protein
MITTDSIGVFGLVIQALLFGGLVWYCVETRRIRVAATAQIEALQTPCLTFVATARNPADAVLGMSGARGALALDFEAGDAMLINIGNGPAVNIEYELVLRGERARKLDGYVSFTPSHVRATIPVSRNSLQGCEYDCVIRYESLSQTKYETRLLIINLVMTPPFEFVKRNKNSK